MPKAYIGSKSSCSLAKQGKNALRYVTEEN